MNNLNKVKQGEAKMKQDEARWSKDEAKMKQIEASSPCSVLIYCVLRQKDEANLFFAFDLRVSEVVKKSLLESIEYCIILVVLL